MLYLKNDRLKVEIAEPGELYKNSRFDWHGMIMHITLDGRHSFCVPESLSAGEGTGGHGLYNEFGIHSPIGFDDASIGDKFPKLGIGLLTKDEDREYKFFKPYEINPFSSNVRVEDNSICFEVLPAECRGYAARLSKKISLESNKMRIEYFLENTGSKPVRTTEYCHNFVAVDNHRIGPEYTLRFSFPVKPDRESSLLAFSEKQITWKEAVNETFYTKLINLPQEEGSYWELIHTPSGAGMRETVDFKLLDFAIWGTNHVVSPEAFINIDIVPGEKLEWKREYEFFNIRV